MRDKIRRSPPRRTDDLSTRWSRLCHASFCPAEPRRRACEIPVCLRRARDAQWRACDAGLPGQIGTSLMAAVQVGNHYGGWTEAVTVMRGARLAAATAERSAIAAHSSTQWHIRGLQLKATIMAASNVSRCIGLLHFQRVESDARAKAARRTIGIRPVKPVTPQLKRGLLIASIIIGRARSSIRLTLISPPSW
jgi:hypothetical protein